MKIHEIVEILKNRNYRTLLQKNNIDVLSYVPFASTVEEAIHCLKNNITSKPMCEYNGCDQHKAFRYYTNTNNFYSDGCCYAHTSKVKNMKKYGVENISQLSDVKEKKKSTTLKNYGVENPKQSPEIAKKIESTMYSMYGGFGWAGQVNDKIKETMTTKYGANNPMHVKQQKEKMSKTLFNKIIKRLNPYVKPNFKFESYLGSEAEQEWICKTCETVFCGKINNGKIPRCPTCWPITVGTSLGEQELFTRINVDEKYKSDKTILKTKELDIYLPTQKVAIEFNGLYWHSEKQGKDENYHLTKSLQCEEKGIKLIHIFEDEWTNSPDLVLSKINRITGIHEIRLQADATNVIEVSMEEKTKFLKNNNLFGDDCSEFSIGLEFNNELVFLTTFKERYDSVWDCCTVCEKNGTTVDTGFDTVMKEFIALKNPKKIIMSVDRRFPDTEFLGDFGFELKAVKPPEAHIVDLNKMIRYSDGQYIESDESQYSKIWDCGNFLFEWKNEDV